MVPATSGLKPGELINFQNNSTNNLFAVQLLSPKLHVLTGLSSVVLHFTNAVSRTHLLQTLHKHLMDKDKLIMVLILGKLHF